MKGICFIEPLFQAIIAGEKTQTRRIVPANGIQRYKKDEILFLKEPYKVFEEEVIYKFKTPEPHQHRYFWKNKLFMPEKFARYFIQIKNVRRERLQSITDEDCVKEAAVQWLLDYVHKKIPIYESEFYIKDEFNSYSKNVSYCFKCVKKEIKKLKEEAKKDGATKEQINAICYDFDDESPQYAIPHCNNCGKTLAGFILGKTYNYLKKWNFEINEETIYVLNQKEFYDLELKEIEELPNGAYKKLIDVINGTGTWESNPYVFVYDFQLYKEQET
jgi:hypothetical protein